MSDVLQLAGRYRSRLRAELAKVEEFLRMAEELSKGGDLESRLPFTTGNGEAKPAEAKPAEAEPKAEPKARAAEAEPKGKAAEAPKTPFDRFRAAGD